MLEHPFMTRDEAEMLYERAIASENIDMPMMNFPKMLAQSG